MYAKNVLLYRVDDKMHQEPLLHVALQRSMFQRKCMIKRSCEKQIFENGWLNLDNPSPNVIIINKNFKWFWFLDE